MNPLIWCAVGAIAGWLAGTMMPAPGLANRVENVLVGVFGAFIGGDFLSAVLGGPMTGFRASSLGLAVGCAVALLALLAVFRRAVGPLRPHKLRKKPRQ
jgi:uncharacterized membrane protein YeaQ/YmgE (transglycosylase-associated protein family)